MVDPALDHEDPVGDAQLARQRVGRVEDDDLAAAGGIVERQEDHRLAPLGRQLLDRRDDPAHGHDLAVAPALELGEDAIGLPAQLLAHRLQRVLGDVEAERLLLELQQLGLLVLARRDHRVVLRPLLLDAAGRVAADVEDRRLPRQPVGRVLLPPRERLLETREHPHPRRSGRVESTALDQCLQ